MLNGLYSHLGSAAVTIISVSVMLLLGFLMTRLTSLLRLPNVTAYIIVGILIGPFCLDLIPEQIVKGTEFLPDIALAFIAFSTGEFFRFETLKKNGGKVLVITMFESLTASLFVFILTFAVLGLDLSFSVVLASLAAATAPASTLMTIRQTKAKGDFVDTLLQVVALDDMIGLVAFSIALSVAVAGSGGGKTDPASILIPVASNVGVLLLGGLFGLFMKLIISKSRSTDNRLIISVSLLFAFCGICAMFGISPLLGCMSMGTVYINLSDDDKLFKQLNYFSPPILLLFFVRSGVSFDLNALIHPSGAVGKTPLILIGILYFVVRMLGKYAGAFIGCLTAGKPKKTRNYLGLALIPQAGVAIGLASLGARTLGGEAGNALNTIILASSVLYELAGPAGAKLALYLSGSYSNKLEDLAPVPLDENGEKKTDVQILIERIKKIQSELPPENPAEKAFTDAAENYLNFLPERKPGIKRNIK